MAEVKDLIEYSERFNSDEFGKWVVLTGHAGTNEDPIPMPYVDYSKTVLEFEQCVYEIADMHPEYDLHAYSKVLEENGLEWSEESLANAEESQANEQCLLAMLMGVIRADRFSEGILLKFLEKGHIQRWLMRLREMQQS